MADEEQDSGGDTDLSLSWKDAGDDPLAVAAPAPATRVLPVVEDKEAVTIPDLSGRSIARRPPKRPEPESDLFGDYLLGPQLGQGGMAVVHAAILRSPIGPGAPCVLKRPRRELLADADYLEMFREEAKLARMLDHANIARALDAGEVEGVPYIAFERLDAVSFGELLRLLGDPPVSVVIQVAAGVAAALVYAHALTRPDGQALQIVHRDVSPENVLLTRAGKVKLIDFGIARFEGRDHATRTGDVKGKARYMAPEQAEGRAIDARTDLYALGVLMADALEALAPAPPGALVRSVRATPGPLPTSLHELMLAMTAFDPAQRPASAALVLERLRQVTVDRHVPLAAYVQAEIFAARPPIEGVSEPISDPSPTLVPEEPRTVAAARPRGVIVEEGGGWFWPLMALWAAALAAATLFLTRSAS